MPPIGLILQRHRRDHAWALVRLHGFIHFRFVFKKTLALDYLLLCHDKMTCFCSITKILESCLSWCAVPKYEVEIWTSGTFFVRQRHFFCWETRSNAISLFVQREQVSRESAPVGQPITSSSSSSCACCPYRSLRPRRRRRFHTAGTNRRPEFDGETGNIPVRPRQRQTGNAVRKWRRIWWIRSNAVIISCLK